MGFIIPRLIGGLGNQLFTLSAAYVVQQIQPYPKPAILLPPSQENAHSVRDYFEVFSKFPQVSKIEIPDDFLKGPVEFMIFAQNNQVNFFSPQKISYSHWDPYEAKLPCLMEGYFQFYPPFEPFIKQIREIILSSLPAIQPQEAYVFIHVRRGDYVAKSDFHFLQDDEYYIKALQHFDIQNIKFLIFSDDIEYCINRSIFTSLPNREFITNLNELEVLAHMASCKGGAICANSTFSWWGAVLGDSHKIIIPSRWSKDEPECLIPDKWIKI
jgi:hypothetical protein